MLSCVTSIAELSDLVRTSFGPTGKQLPCNLEYITDILLKVVTRSLSTILENLSLLTGLLISNFLQL